MKKLIGLLIMILISLNINAQEKFETAAKTKITKMNEVMTLSEAQQQQIYDIELSKNIKIAEIRKENADNQDVIKEKVAEANKAAYADMRKVAGPDKMKIWSDYLKEQKEQKAKKE